MVGVARNVDEASSLIMERNDELPRMPLDYTEIIGDGLEWEI